MENVNNFNLIFGISSIKLAKLTENSNIILIKFVFNDKVTNQIWKVKKAYDVLIPFLKKLCEILPNLVSPPLINEKTDLDNYKIDLYNYLYEIFNRPDAYNLKSIKDFFEFNNDDNTTPKGINNNISENIINLPINTNFENDVIDIYFKNPYLFISLGNNKSLYKKVLSFSSFKSLFEHKGQIQIFKLENGNYGENEFKKIFEDTYDFQISKIIYNNSFLCLSFFDGKIIIYKFFNEFPNKLYTLDSISTRKILNFHFDYDKGYIYSFSENENFLNITEVNYNKSINQIKLCQYYIKLSYFDFENIKKIIVIDSRNCIWIFDFVDESNINKLQGIHTNYNDITTMTVYIYEKNELYIFIGTNNKIILYKYYEMKFTEKLVLNIGFICKNIIYEKDLNSLIICCDNSTLQFWKHLNSNPEFVFETNVPNHYIKIEKNNTFFCYGGKYLKYYKILSNVFYSEKRRINQIINENNIINEIIYSINSIGENKMNLLRKALSGSLGLSKNENEKKEEINLNMKEEIEDDGLRSLDGWDEIEPFKLEY